MFALNRRGDHPAMVAHDTSDTAARGESWKAPREPSNGSHRVDSSCSKSAGFS